MARDAETASETVTRKPDDAVGSPGEPAAGGGGHTAEQSAVTDMGGGGRSDGDRRGSWGGEAGRAPPTPGGSSAGHSDRKASSGPETDRPVAAGRSKTEQEGGA